MKKLNEIRILKAFDFYLDLLKAFNSTNFTQNNPRRVVRNIGFTCGITSFLSTIPVIAALSIWCLFDSSDALQQFIVVVPLLLTMLQMLLMQVAFTMKNRAISAAIERLQIVVNQRK